MIAKLIAHGATREAALDRLTDALDNTVIAGPRTNVAFLAALCRSNEFRRGTVDTGFIDRNLAALGAVAREPDLAAAALGVERLLVETAEVASESAGVASDDTSHDVNSPWAATDGFQLGGTRALSLPVVIDGQDVDATVTYAKGGAHVAIGGVEPASTAAVFVAHGDAYVLRDGHQTRVRVRDLSAASAGASGGDGTVRAPMHGRVLQLFASAGEAVTRGQPLAVIEAMKMEHTLHAPFAGVVQQVSVSAGAQVVEGGEIMVIEPAETR